jgi:hypothetical protein
LPQCPSAPLLLQLLLLPHCRRCPIAIYWSIIARRCSCPSAPVPLQLIDSLPP